MGPGAGSLGSLEGYTHPEEKWGAGVPRAPWEHPLKQRKASEKGVSELFPGVGRVLLYPMLVKSPWWPGVLRAGGEGFMEPGVASGISQS